MKCRVSIWTIAMNKLNWTANAKNIYCRRHQPAITITSPSDKSRVSNWTKFSTYALMNVTIFIQELSWCHAKITNKHTKRTQRTAHTHTAHTAEALRAHVNNKTHQYMICNSCVLVCAVHFRHHQFQSRKVTLNGFWSLRLPPLCTWNARKFRFRDSCVDFGNQRIDNTLSHPVCVVNEYHM